MILKELVGLMDVGYDSFEDLCVCELGDQRMKWHPAKTGKKYLLEKGVAEHVSLDWNGKNGALKRDLSKPVDEWQSYFDMVTNFGTTEHVENGQFEVFENIHNFTKNGGVMIHAVPLVGHWKGHCNYHYKEDFMDALALYNNYECILSEVRQITGRRGRTQPMVCGVLRKNDNPFMSKEDFTLMDKIVSKK